MGNKIDPLEVIELMQPKIKKLLYQTSIGNYNFNGKNKI